MAVCNDELLFISALEFENGVGRTPTLTLPKKRTRGSEAVSSKVRVQFYYVDANGVSDKD